MELKVGMLFIGYDGSEYLITKIHDDYFKYRFRPNSKTKWIKIEQLMGQWVLKEEIKAKHIFPGTPAGKTLYGSV